MIKSILKYFFSKLAKAFEKEVGKAGKWVDNTQEKFAQMIEDANESEERIDQVIKEAKDKINDLNRIIAQALEDKKRLHRLHGKVVEVSVSENIAEQDDNE